MSVRKVAIRRRAGAASEEESPKRDRVWLFWLLTFSAGVIAAIAVLVGPGLWADLETSNATPGNSATQSIKAHALFPPIGVVHKVVTVYDPPPTARPIPPAEPPDD